MRAGSLATITAIGAGAFSVACVILYLSTYSKGDSLVPQSLALVSITALPALGIACSFLGIVLNPETKRDTAIVALLANGAWVALIVLWCLGMF
jgi:hypothetical protein